MTTSDWGRWLIDEVEDADVDGLSLWYLGCNGAILKASDGTIVYIDPYLGTGDPPRTVRMIPVPFEPDAPAEATAVFVTHEHTDHLHGPTQGPLLAKTGATLIAESGCIDLVRDRDWVGRFGIAEDQLVAVSPGESHTYGGIDVTVYPGTDPDAAHGVTFVFEHGSQTVVHPGDGRPAGALEAIDAAHDVDLVLAAVGSTGMIPDKHTGAVKRTQWYNDHDACVQVATQLRATTLVPTHWDMWKGLTTDPWAVDAHRRSFDHPRRVTVLEIGDRIDLSGELS